jgi:hypothetical protein
MLLLFFLYFTSVCFFISLFSPTPHISRRGER